MRQLRVAIIGQGRSGRNIHAAALTRLPEMYKIVAVAELLEFHRAKAARELGCEVYANYLDIVERGDIDLFVNSTYSDQHLPISIELLKRGQTVISEKPLGNSLPRFNELAETVRASQGRFAVFQNCRWYPAYRKMLEIVRSGVLGELVAIDMRENRIGRRWDWQTLKTHLGGELLNKAVHQLDQALYMLGPDYRPEVVHCAMRNYAGIGDAEDYLRLELSAPGFPHVCIESSCFDGYSPYRYLVQGARGTLICRSEDKLEWRYYRADEAPRHIAQVYPILDENQNPAYCSDKLDIYSESWESPAGMSADVLGNLAYYRALYAALAECAPMPVTLAQLQLQLEIIDECFSQNP